MKDSRKLNLLQLIKDAGGQDSLRRISDLAAMADHELSELLDAASPLLIRKLQDRMSDAAGRNWIRRLADSGGPQQFIVRPSLIASNAIQIEGNRILDALVGGHASAERLSLGLAHQTRLNVRQVESAVPAVTALFMGAICKALAR